MDTGKNVKVVARFRPENTHELQQGHRVVEFGADQQTCRLSDSSEFVFDRVFGSDSSQEEVFDYSLQQTVDDLMKGYNGTVFAYGQTGSGKSYTMSGPDIEDEHQRGAIPRIVEQIFQQILDSPEDIEYTVRVSYMEIYMERIKDLLSPNNSNDNLSIHEDKTRGIHVKNLTEEYVSSAQEVYRVMQQGARLRAVASTNMNQESSRSHSIFMVVVGQKNLTTGTQKSGQLFLVDLAGSEKVGKTGASGQTLEEAKKINKSLSALGNVINALTDGKSTHIPYRDSKLTRILQESLGGNSRTSLIVNCSPSSWNESETLSTLRFGVRAKTIKNKARVNTELSPMELRSMLKKVQQQLDNKSAYTKKLEQELKHYKDDGGGGGGSANTTPRAGTPMDRLDSPRNSNPTWDEVVKRENELQDQIAERDGVIERQEQELQRLRDDNEVDKLRYRNQEMEVQLESLRADNDRLTELLGNPQGGGAGSNAAAPPTPGQSPASSPVPNAEKKRKMTAELMGDYYQKSQADLVDDALDALSEDNIDQGSVSHTRGLLQQIQRMPEYRHSKVMDADRESFQTLVDSSSSSNDNNNHNNAGDHKKGEDHEVYSAKVRAHENTIAMLMNQVDELTAQNNDLHTRLKHGTSSNAQFEQVKQNLMRDLQDRCEKIVELEISLDEAREQYNYVIKNGYNKSQQKKLALLERNLDQLTQVQRQLINQNNQLKKEAAVATKLLQNRNTRIDELEAHLQQAQAQLDREHDQFQAQLAYLTDQITKSTGTAPQPYPHKVVKPIRGGGGGGGGSSSSSSSNTGNRGSAVWNKINHLVGA